MKLESLKKNIIYSTAYQLMVIIIPIITTPYISRTLGAEGIGDYAYTQSIAYFFFIFSILGVNNYGNRSVAQVRDNKEKLSHTFWQIYYLQFFLTLIMLVLYLVLIYVWERDSFLLSIIQGLLIVSALSDINWFAFGLEKFRFTSSRNMIIKILEIFAIFLFVNSQQDVWKYALIICVGTILGVIVVWPVVLRNTFFEMPNGREIIQHMKPMSILFIPVLATSLYAYMDRIMLGNLIGNRSVGYYSYAENVINVPMGLVIAFCTTLMPRISYLFSSSREDSVDVLYKQSFYFTSILEVAMCAGLYAISDRFILLYLGNEFSETANLLKILVFTIPFLGMGNVVRMMDLIPRKLDNIYVFAVISGATLNILGNALLIPKYEAKGACYMTLLASIIVLVIQIAFSTKVKTYLKWMLRVLPYTVYGILINVIIQEIDDYLIIHFTKSIIILLVEVGIGVLVFIIFYFVWDVFIIQHLELKFLKNKSAGNEWKK